jgi:hypothetical protein
LGYRGAVASVLTEQFVAGLGTGLAALEADGAGRLRLAAPGDSLPGEYVEVLPWQRRALLNAAGTQHARVYCTGTPPAGSTVLTLVDIFNVVWPNVANAERAAGSSRYRAFMLRNMSAANISLRIFLALLGAQRNAAAGYAASGAVTIGPQTGTFSGWPDSGFVKNATTGEVLYYQSRTDALLSVPAGGRDVWAELGGGAAGTLGDPLRPVSGFRLATEVPVGGALQVLGDDDDVPAGLTWEAPAGTTDPDVIEVATLAPGANLGLWVNRKVLAGQQASAWAKGRVAIEADVSGDTFENQVTDQYRIADDSLDRYELFKGEAGAEPDLTAAPWETFASRPHVTAALSYPGDYRFVLARRNRYGLLSRNVKSWALQLDGVGAQVTTPPGAPVNQAIEAGALGAFRVAAEYDYRADGALAADAWLVYLATGGADPDPGVDVPEVVAMSKVGALAVLDWDSVAFPEGTSGKVLVRVRRTGLPAVDSENTAISGPAVATLLGPAAPAESGAFFGAIAEQG